MLRRSPSGSRPLPIGSHSLADRHGFPVSADSSTYGLLVYVEKPQIRGNPVPALQQHDIARHKAHGTDLRDFPPADRPWP